MMAASAGVRIASSASWTAATQDPDGALIISGDYGGTVYLTAPKRFVRCTPDAVRDLAEALDRRVWDDPDGLEISALSLPVGSGVPGGMGGGVVIDDVWMHPRKFTDEDRKAAAAALAGDGLTFLAAPSSS